MTQDRLDQDCCLPLGTRDAVHLPIVVATYKYGGPSNRHELKPGEYVKFVDKDYIYFVPCEKEEAQGILNPFLDEITYFDPVVVFILPGITTAVRHAFEINPEMKTWEKQYLEKNLERAKQEDPACAGCYIIRNNDIIRM
jgi:hypothetical protein